MDALFSGVSSCASDVERQGDIAPLVIGSEIAVGEDAAGCRSKVSHAVLEEFVVIALRK